MQGIAPLSGMGVPWVRQRGQHQANCRINSGKATGNSLGTTRHCLQQPLDRIGRWPQLVQSLQQARALPSRSISFRHTMFPMQHNRTPAETHTSVSLWSRLVQAIPACSRLRRGTPGGYNISCKFPFYSVSVMVTLLRCLHNPILVAAEESLHTVP